MMSSRNATASWSGYAHQGKIGLLISLRKIHAEKCLNLQQFELELETQEDAKLTQNTKVIEVHQVKAYLASDTIGSYTSALEKFEACKGGNYLHTICEITNWSSLTAKQNPQNVLRYQYSKAKDYCLLSEIDGYIITEIKNIMLYQQHEEAENVGWHKQVFESYLSLLDERIRKEHQNGTLNTYCIKFGLEELLSMVISPPRRINAVICSIRRNLFSSYEDLMRQLAEDELPGMSAPHETTVVAVIKKICLLTDEDLETFLQQIFPATAQGKTLATCALTDDFFIGKDFRSTFLFTLFSIEKTPLTLEDGYYPHYKTGLNYLLTALQHTAMDRQSVARKILKNDKLNAVRYETDYIINESFSGRLSEDAPKLIDRKDSLFAEKDLEFITREQAVKNLNQ